MYACVHIPYWVGVRMRLKERKLKRCTKQKVRFPECLLQASIWGFLCEAFKRLANLIFTRVYQFGIFHLCFSVAHSKIRTIIQLSPVTPLETGIHETFLCHNVLFHSGCLYFSWFVKLAYMRLFYAIMFCFIVVVSTFLALLKYCHITLLKMNKKEQIGWKHLKITQTGWVR